ncbi:MAG: D-arabinono-1,4-lactone oxidase [Pseudomonadota bacterium]|nr:D-arabinono-1,4-lactone oxidase [Pseudomonadota bacterium]
MRAKWTNWHGNQTANPERVVTPRSVAEVSDVFERTPLSSGPIRVLGAGAAWSQIAASSTTMLSTRGLTAIRHVDRERRRITVEAGALMFDVVDAATHHGLSLRAAPMYLGLSVGGVIATGSHGTGRDAATVGDDVVSFELVTADGRVVDIPASDSDLARSLIANLGMLGVVTAVTLQAEPIYNVLEHHQHVPAGDVGSLIASLLAEYEFVSVFWYPGSLRAVLKLGNRTSLPATVLKGRIRPSLAEKCAEWLGPIVPVIASRLPAFMPVAARALNAGIGQGSIVVSEPFFSHYQQAYPPCISSEYAVPVEAAPAAWTWMHRRLTQYGRSGIQPVDLVVHARFTGPSRGFLATAAGRATCHLEHLSFRGNRHRALFQPEFDEVMRREHHGRPHWGKELVDPWKAAEAFGPDVERFLEVREALDPHQRLLHPFLRDDVFGLARRQRRPVRAAIPQAV